MFIRYNNILNFEEQQTCVNILEQPKWQFIGTSNNEDPFTFWYRDLNTEEFFTNLFFTKVCEITEKKFTITRVYANGQTYGLSGSLHMDHDDDRYYTFLYYANPYWNVEWGGSTAFYKNEKEFITAEFIPNSSIFFKSNIMHVGLEPSRHFRGLRITVAYKLKEII